MVGVVQHVLTGYNIIGSACSMSFAIALSETLSESLSEKMIKECIVQSVAFSLPTLAFMCCR